MGGPADGGDGRLAGVDRRRKGPLETVIVKPGQILLQERGGAFVRLQDRRAKLRAGATKEFELSAAFLPRIEPVDFTGDPEHGQPVGLSSVTA